MAGVQEDLVLIRGGCAQQPEERLLTRVERNPKVVAPIDHQHWNLDVRNEVHGLDGIVGVNPFRRTRGNSTFIQRDGMLVRDRDNPHPSLADCARFDGG